MTGTDFDNRIHLGLYERAKFSHKIGNWPETNTWHDCGILLDNKNPAIICVMSEGIEFNEFITVASATGREFVTKYETAK